MQKPKSGTYYLGAIVYPYRKIYPWKLVSNSGRDWQWFYFAPLNPWTSLFCSRFFSMKVLVIWLLSTAHMSITCRKPSFTWSEGQKPLWLSSSNYHKLLLLPWWVNYSPLRWGPQPLLLPYNFHSILFLHFLFPCEEARCDQFLVWLQSELAGWCLGNLVRGTVGTAICQHGCPAALHHFAHVVSTQGTPQNRRHSSRDNWSRLRAEQGTSVLWVSDNHTKDQVNWTGRVPQTGKPKVL